MQENMREITTHTLHWVQGNTVNFAIPLQKETKTQEGKIVEDYYPDAQDIVSVFACGKYLSTQLECVVNDNVVVAKDNGNLKVGVYGIEIRITKADGTRLRSMWNSQVEIHKTNDGVITQWNDFLAPDSQLLDAVIFFFAKGDKGDRGLSAYEVAVENGFVGTEEEWLESLHAHIEDVYTREQSDERYVRTEDGKGLSANDYTDAEKEKLAGLSNYDDTAVRRMIADTDANLANYYTKQESYSANQIDTLLRTQRQGRFVVVQTLPDPSEDTMFRIYLVPKRDAGADNIKDEFITLEDGGDYAWEKIGSTKVDLSGYSTTAQMNAAIASALDNYYDKATVDGMLAAKQDTIDDLDEIRSGAGKGATAYQKSSTGIPFNDLSFDVRTSLVRANIALQTETDPTVPSWAKAKSKPSYTAIEVGAVPTTRKVNGKALSSDITLDASDVGALPDDTPLFSGSYNDLRDKPTIPTVPTNLSEFNNDAGYLTSHQDISGKEDVTSIVTPVNETDATLPITTLTTEIGKYYRIDVPIETLSVILPAMGVVTSIKTVVIYLTGGITPAVTITSADSKDVYYQDGYEIEAGKTYEINALYNGSAWVIASVEIVMPTNEGE